MMRVLKRRNAVLTAVGGMWTLAALGVFIVIHTGNLFVLPSVERLLTIAQLAGFYIAYFGAKIPATAFVAFIISRSEFARSSLAAAVVVSCCELVGFVIHLFRWPWSTVSGVARWAPLAFDIAGIVILTLLVAGLTWLFRKANNAVGMKK